MAEHNNTGKQGEEMAVQFLRIKGYEIIALNMRFGRAEVDIIARIGLETVFVEVKTRSSEVYGYPEESVNNKKINLLAKAAEAFALENPSVSDIRFDLISIVLGANEPEITHIEDAFFPDGEWF